VRASQVGGAVSGLYDATGIAVSPDGNDVYVAGSYDDSVVTLRREPGED
jgi:DNA-binding beta-propeller fold protein YncE